MKNKTRKLLSTILALAMVFSLFAAMPITASAAHGPSTIDLEDLADGDTYTNWSYTDTPFPTITLTGDVTVIGTKTNANSVLRINLNGYTVTWTATYEGNTVSNALVSLNGFGEFILNSTLTQNSTISQAIQIIAAPTVTINSGGSIIANGGNNGISGSTGTVNVNGGTIQTIGTGTAISSIGGGEGPVNININSGTVSAVNGTAIELTHSGATVNISGGTVSATGSGNAIESAGKVTLSGGMVSANTGTAIDANEIEVTGTATVGNNGSATPIYVTGTGGLYTSAATGNLTVTGGVTVGASSGVYVDNGGKITINGNVALGNNAAIVSNDNGTMTVNGNVTSTYTRGEIGAYTGSETYITGTISTNTEIYVDSVTLTVGTPTTANGLTYNGYYWDVYANTAVTSPSSYVYHRQAPFTPTIAVTSTGLGSLTVGTAVTGSVVYTLTDGTYAATITPANFAVTGLPAGLSAGTAVRTSNTVVTVPITGTPTTANASTTAITLPANIPAANVTGASSAITVSGTVTASSVASGGGGSNPGGSNPGGNNPGGGDDGGGDDTSPVTTIPGGDGTVSIPYTITDGIATLELPSDTVDEIIDNATDDNAVLDLSEVPDATGAAMPKEALEQLADAELSLEVNLPQGTIMLDNDALNSLVTQADSADITISLNEVDHSSLTPEQIAAINPGDLVFNISVMSGTQTITNFDGTITVSVPYTGELPVAVWYLNDAGELEKLDCLYDADTNTVTFTTNHLSLYVVGLDNDPTPITPVMPVNPFSDVFGTDWFIDDVIYAYSRGLIQGTSATTFSPNDNLTYAEAVTLAARMHELYTTGEVTLENGDDLWYQSYVDYAIENGIISTDDYDWDAEATRVGYMQIFANALPDDALAAINSVTDGSIPDVPMDYPGAAAIYKLYRAGILQGNDDAHTCNPDASILRCEVAAILTRMMNPDARIEFSM